MAETNKIRVPCKMTTTQRDAIDAARERIGITTMSDYLRVAALEKVARDKGAENG